MDLFTYLMAKNGNNTSVHGDLFSYLLGKGQSQTYTVSGVTIYIPNAKKLVSFMMTKESTQATSILPSEYTQVDYIKSSKTQYLLLNYNAKTTSSYELSLKFDNANDDWTNSKKAFISGRDFETTNSQYFQINFGSNQSEKQILYVWINSGQSSAIAYQDVGNVIENKNSLIINNGQMNYGSYSSTTPIATGVNSQNGFLLFAGRFTSGGNTPAIFDAYDMYVYDFKIYESNVLVKHYIPCYRNSDNEVGLYEIIDGEFFANQGTGAFTYGSIAQLPNPDYPQEVKTVKGHRNLLNINDTYIKRNNFGSITISDGVITVSNDSTTHNAYGWVIPVEQNKQITIGFDNTTASVSLSYVRVAFIEEPITQITDLTLGTAIDNNIKYITLTSTTNYMLIFIRVPQTTYSITNLIATYSNDKLPYVPYGNNYICTKVVGKNLFNQKWESGNINATTGNNENANDRIRTIGYIPVTPNIAYYISRTIATSNNTYRFYDENYNYLGYNGTANMMSGGNLTANTYNGTFTILNSNVKYMRIADVTTDTSTKYLLQYASIEDKTYEPYQENNIPIPLNGNEIAGIGDYKDELLVDKSGHVWLNKKTGKKVFDGSETWNIYNTTSTSVRFRTEISDIEEYKTGSSMPNLLCNRFIPESFNATWKIGNISRIIYSSFEQSVIFIYNLNTSLADWKTWLSTHNTEVYYVLATPDPIDLNTTVDLRLFKGVNNITNSEDCNMTIEYR